MIVNKKNTATVVSNNATNSQYSVKVDSSEVETTVEASEMPDNGIIDVYNAIKTILKNVRWKYNDTKSEKIFKTVQYNGGQYEYEVTGDGNTMSEIAFPAAFVSFINMRWTSGQNTVSEGSAELRIQFVMNTLNNYDDDKDTEVFYVAQRIIQTIQEERENYECLQKQCKIEFMDTATYYHGGLQSCWLTYQVKFVEISVWATRNRVRRYIVVPPFTKHSDQKDPDTQNILKHTNADHTRTYDESSKFNLLDEES